MGTRCFNMAQYVVFKSRLQMLADNPVNYYNNEECARYIMSVPVEWDESIVLDAEVGKYVVVARRKGNRWFVGGMRAGDDNPMSYTLNLGFLTKGRSYKMTLFSDGVNASRQAMDYVKEQQSVSNDSKITLTMVRNGGFVALIE